jgi:Pectate lyase superfamily protein
MATVYMVPVGPLYQALTDTGAIGNGYKLYTYVGGTVSTPQTTYTDSTGTVANSNPIILGSNGRFQSVNVWVTTGVTLKLVLTDSTGAAITGGTIDNVPAVNNVTATNINYTATATGAASRTIASKLNDIPSVKDFGAIGDGSNDDTSAIQLALNARGMIYIPSGTYKITSTLTVYGNTELFGAGLGVSILKWYGATSGRIIQDSSYVTSSDVNLNIILRDFEVNGNAYASNTLTAVSMYRVGKIKYERLYLHDVGSSLLNWGYSQTDTVDVQIVGCIFERCYNGDAVQGVGTRVLVKDCYAFSAGDTCYAVLYDSNATTNPTSAYSSNIVFESCVAKGEYNAAGAFTGSGRAQQLGFALGPFNTSINVYITVSNCLCENLYLNCWFVVFNKLKLTGNTFKSHSNTTTGGVRLDGVSNVTITGNSFESSIASASAYYSTLFLNAQRNTYGASNFDASNQYTAITGNTFQQNTTPGIILAVDPTYSVSLTDLTISGNTFAGVNLPLQFKPLTSAGTAVYQNIAINGNTANSTATTFATVAGAFGQYSNVALAENIIGTVTPVGGTAGAWDNFLIAGSNTQTVSAADGAATTVFTMPSSGYNQIQIESYVRAAAVAYTAVAVLAINAGVPKILWQQNGATCTLTLSGNNVRVTQSGIGTQTVYTTVKWLS